MSGAKDKYQDMDRNSVQVTFSAIIDGEITLPHKGEEMDKQLIAEIENRLENVLRSVVSEVVVDNIIIIDKDVKRH